MTKGKNTTICILFTFLLAAFAGSIIAGENETIVGVITDDGQIVGKNGVIYEIGENDKFDAVTENTDVKIEVNGMVAEDDGGNKIIMIERFKVLE
jgi:hypothetical protein